jgi:hypothetical protein
MKVLNRNQQFTVDLSMRGACAPISCLFAGLMLADCMRTSSPVAIGPRNDLDSMAYGAPSCAPPTYWTRAVADSGGAISALGNPGDTVPVSERRF